MITMEHHIPRRVMYYLGRWRCRLWAVAERILSMTERMSIVSLWAAEIRPGVVRYPVSYVLEIQLSKYGQS
jgi:hypothetical protein